MGLLETRMHRWSVVTAAAAVVLVALPWAAEAAGTPLAAAAAERLRAFGIVLALGAVLFWFSPDPRDTARPEILRRYYREAFVPVVVYMLLVPLLRWLLPDRESLAVRAVFATLFLVYLGLLTRAFVRYVRDSDELQRRIELESIAIATAIVAMGYTLASLLQRARLIAVDAEGALASVFPAALLAYVVVRVIHGRRYQ